MDISTWRMLHASTRILRTIELTEKGRSETITGGQNRGVGEGGEDINLPTPSFPSSLNSLCFLTTAYSQLTTAQTASEARHSDAVAASTPPPPPSHHHHADENYTIIKRKLRGGVTQDNAITEESQRQIKRPCPSTLKSS